MNVERGRRSSRASRSLPGRWPEPTRGGGSSRRRAAPARCLPAPRQSDCLERNPHSRIGIEAYLERSAYDAASDARADCECRRIVENCPVCVLHARQVSRVRCRGPWEGSSQSDLSTPCSRRSSSVQRLLRFRSRSLGTGRPRRLLRDCSAAASFNFVDSRLKGATCVGTGKARAGRYSSFTCQIEFAYTIPVVIRILPIGTGKLCVPTTVTLPANGDPAVQARNRRT